MPGSRPPAEQSRGVVGPAAEVAIEPLRDRRRTAIDVIKALAVNAIPLWGLARSGWDGSTLLCFYWTETLLGTPLNGVRIALHRRLTHKRGYYLPPGAGARRPNGFLREYLLIAAAFNLVHGVLLAGLLLLMRRNFAVPLPAVSALAPGVAWLGLALLLGLALDLRQIRRRTFAWARRLRDVSVQRVFLIHMTIILGTALMAWRGTAAAFFVLFAALKLALDLAAASVSGNVPETPPRWLGALMRRLDPHRDSASFWRRTVLDQRAAAALAEETAPPA